MLPNLGSKVKVQGPGGMTYAGKWKQLLMAETCCT